MINNSYFSPNITNEIYEMICDKIKYCFIGVYQNTKKKYKIEKKLKSFNYKKVIIACNKYNLQKYDIYDNDELINDFNEICDIKLNYFNNKILQLMNIDPRISNIYFYEDKTSNNLFDIIDNNIKITSLINLRNNEIHNMNKKISKRKNKYEINYNIHNFYIAPKIEDNYNEEYNYEELNNYDEDIVYEEENKYNVIVDNDDYYD